MRRIWLAGMSDHVYYCPIATRRNWLNGAWSTLKMRKKNPNRRQNVLHLNVDVTLRICYLRGELPVRPSCKPETLYKPHSNVSSWRGRFLDVSATYLQRHLVCWFTIREGMGAMHSLPNCRGCLNNSCIVPHRCEILNLPLATRNKVVLINLLASGYSTGD